ncbi:hypothetical protein F66182_10613, partial [Fusarium sp. NRRL 66182]
MILMSSASDRVHNAADNDPRHGEANDAGENTQYEASPDISGDPWWEVVDWLGCRGALKGGHVHRRFGVW